MAQDIFSYIREAYASGMTKDEMMFALRTAGWDDADIRIAFTEYESPKKEEAQLVEELLQRKPSGIPVMEDIEPLIAEQPLKKFSLKFSKNIFATLGVIFASVAIVAGVIGIRSVIFKSAEPAQFSLEASTSDIEGISSETTFILKSSRAFSEDEIKKFIAFTPPLEFSVKKIASGTSFIPVVYAEPNPVDIDSLAAPVATYEIKPTELLGEQKIYRVMVTDENVADQEYQWAFQVKAPFQIISTNPASHATYIPLNTGIEMVFSREDVLDPQSSFDISPKVDGTFEQHSGTFVFLPKGLSEKTVYTVTLKKGLKTEASGEMFDNDYVFSFETGEKEYTGVAENISLSRQFQEFVPGRKPVIEVSANYEFDLKKDGKNVDVNVFSFASADDFLKAYRESSITGNESWALYQGKDESSDIFAKYAKKEFSFKPKIVSAQWQSFIELPKDLKSGYYAFQLSYKKSHSYEWGVVTPLTHYYALSGAKSFMWLYDFVSKKPIPHTAVSVIASDGTEDAISSTQENGLVEFATPQTLQSEGRGDEGIHADFLKVLFGKETILIPASAASYSYPSYWSYISSDRYTYQMTDTVRFWGVLKGKNEDLRGKKAHLELRGGDQYTTIEATDVVVSQFDTVQGEISFQGATPGYYTLELSTSDSNVQNIPIQIMTYVKPAYLITASATQPSVYADTPVNFDVKAAFFDGTPVSGVKLHYSGWWIGEDIEGDVTLDESGKGTVTYTPTYSESEWSYYPQNLELTFKPVLSEEGEIWGTANVLVFGPQRYIQSFSEDIGNDSYRLRAKVNKLQIEKVQNKNPDLWSSEFVGDPAPGEKLTARVVKHTTMKKETGQYFDPIDKIVRKQYDYWIEDKTIEKIPGITDANGEWTFEKKFPHEDDSWYEVFFEGKDESGRVYSSSESLWYFSGYNTWKQFSISLDKKDTGQGTGEKKYSVGEKIQLAVRVAGEKKNITSPALFFRTGSDIESVAIQNGLEYEDTFVDSFIPSVSYRAVILGPYGFEESNDVTARFLEKDRGLSIEITPDKKQYRPGELVSLDISVQDKNKKGVVSEVNLAAIDESLYHMLPYSYEQNILEKLYSGAESLAWITSNAAQYIQLNKGGVEGGGCFTGDTPIRMSDGLSKNIRDVHVGDRILTFASEKDRILVPAVVQGISWHQVDGYLIVNNDLQVTPEHRMFINGMWQVAGVLKKGDVLLNTDGKNEIVSSVEYVEAGNTLVHNIVVGTYHTYFAGNRFVHNQEKGGGDMRVRQKFEDTALYESVHTDQGGRARTTFTAPDNITSWRVLAQGFSPDGIRAGQTTHLIPISLPFFIDTTIGTTYLTGDDPTIRVRAFGSELKQDQEMEFVLKSDALHLDKKETVKGNEVSFQLGSLPEGQYQLTISASQGTLKDTVMRPLVVVRSYFQKYEAAGYDVTPSLSNIEGKKDGYTDLAFMDMGRGRFYDALYKNFYSPGIRVDQVLPAYYAAQFLSRYFGETAVDEDIDIGPYQSAEKGGGVGLFPYSDPDVELTARLSDLAPEIISKEGARGYFQKTLDDEKTDIHRIAKALYGLSVFNDPVLVKVKKVQQKKDELTLEDHIYLTLALVRFGDFASARRSYEENIKNHLRFDGPQAWIDEEQDMTKRVKLTGMAGVIASELGEEGDARSFWEYMRTHDPERDLDTLEELLFIRSELEKSSEEKSSFTYKTISRGERVSLENGNIYHLTVSADELKTLSFSNVQGNIRLITAFERDRSPEELQKNGELSIRRAYFVGGEPVMEFKDGDIVHVQIDPNILDSALDGTYQVVDYLPSGLKPITQMYRLGLENTGTECDPTWYPVRVQNNAVYFLTYKGFDKTEHCTNRTINYYARVVTKGTYNANPSLIQSMENLESLNVSRQDTVTIK